MKINYQDFKTKFNSELRSWLDSKKESFNSSFRVGLAKKIIDRVDKIAMAEAKRIRPFVVFLMYKEAQQDEKDIDWKPFLAIELFHLFGLIHDDIMDCDSKRRGKKTVHEFIKETEFNDEDRSTHVSNSLAILAGDLVYSWVNELFFQSKSYPIEAKRRAKEYFFKMSEEVMVGQIMDMDNREGKDVEYLFKKMSLKTSSYTFVRPMQIGVALGGGSENKMKFCEKWGQKMGLAFQIQDNLIDFTSSETGKDDFSDIKEGTLNILTYFVKQNKPESFDNILKATLNSKEISKKEKKQIKNLFESSGAIEYAENQVENYLNKSKQLLQEYELSTEIKTELSNLINLLENRKK